MKIHSIKCLKDLDSFNRHECEGVVVHSFEGSVAVVEKIFNETPFFPLIVIDDNFKKYKIDPFRVFNEFNEAIVKMFKTHVDFSIKQYNEALIFVEKNNNKILSVQDYSSFDAYRDFMIKYNGNGIKYQATSVIETQLSKVEQIIDTITKKI